MMLRNNIALIYELSKKNRTTDRAGYRKFFRAKKTPKNHFLQQSGASAYILYNH